MEAIVTFLIVSFAHSLALPASCPLTSEPLSLTSTFANFTLPVNITSLVNTTNLSANSTASGLYAPGQVRTKIWNFGSLFQFSNVADVNEVIAAATLDILRHGDGETMSELAYRAGPGGGRGVLLRLEPLHQEAVNMTWGMWRSALGDITAYYDKVGKVPIDFYITYSIGLRNLLFGDGSLVHDLCGEADEGLIMEQMA